MTPHKIITIIIASCLIVACAGRQPADSKAVHDTERALGLVLVEHGGQKLLKMVVCAVQGGQLPEDAALADESLCPNAFVTTAGKGYYFSELQPRGVKNRLRRRGYLKLGSLLLVPLAIGTVVGWRARPLVKRLKLIFTAEGKPVLDRGAANSKAVNASKNAQERALADVRTNTKVGVAGGAIMSIATLHHMNNHLWGKGERLTVAHWDDIFRIQCTSEPRCSFSNAKVLTNEHAITHILTTLAKELAIAVNPAVISSR